MSELWKSIPGWPYYVVSSYGNVSSTEKQVPGKNGSRKCKTCRKKQFLEFKERTNHE